jgi:uncharacterized protein
MKLIHPKDIFDRGGEWRELTAFINEPSRLGVVWGPRRAGKSVLLSALAEAAGGLYIEAVRQDPALSLADIGRVVGARVGVGTVRYATWSEAFDGLLSLPNCPIVVLDEFGYLCEASPELPSIIQRAIDRSRRGKLATSKPTGRLVLCGSAVAQISHLLDRDQPLFGRAQLAQVVDAFDFRTSAGYWGLAKVPKLAVLVHAVLGGLPGYRDVVIEGPKSLADFDEWITSRVLTPASPLLEEDTLVLQSSGLSANVYRSILTAVARGDRTPTGISSRTGRPATALARPIERLTEAGLLVQVSDPVRARRSRYELADPFISFHDAIIRPNRTRIRRRQQHDVWSENQATWNSQIVGPHFERLCREATLTYGSEFGLSSVASVGATSIADAKARRSHEVDLVATRTGGDIMAIGEAKHTTTARSPADLERLEHIRGLLPTPAGRRSRLLLFSDNGFERNLVRLASSRTDVELIDVDRLYGR